MVPDHNLLAGLMLTLVASTSIIFVLKPYIDVPAKDKTAPTKLSCHHLICMVPTWLSFRQEYLYNQRISCFDKAAGSPWCQVDHWREICLKEVLFLWLCVFAPILLKYETINLLSARLSLKGLSTTMIISLISTIPSIIFWDLFWFIPAVDWAISACISCIACLVSCWKASSAANSLIP